MSDDRSNLLDYHVRRSVEELDRAATTGHGIASQSHLELSRLHSHQADWLREAKDGNPAGQRTN